MVGTLIEETEPSADAKVIAEAILTLADAVVILSESLSPAVADEDLSLPDTLDG